MRKSRIIIAIALVSLLLVGLLVGCSATDNVKGRIKDMAKGKNYTMTIERDVITGDPFRYVYSSKGDLTHYDAGTIKYYYDRRGGDEVTEYYYRGRGVWFHKQIPWVNDTPDNKDIERGYLELKTYKALMIALAAFETHYEIVEIENPDDVEKYLKVWSLKKTSEDNVFASTEINRKCHITAKGTTLTINITHGTKNKEVATINKINSTSIKLPTVDIKK